MSSGASTSARAELSHSWVEDNVTEALTTQLVNTSISDASRPPRPNRPRKRSSLGELRVPPGYQGAAEPGPIQPQPGATEATEHNGVTRTRKEAVPAPPPPIAHPFEGSVQLLRRCVSDEDIASFAQDQDDDLPSDVSTKLQRRQDTALLIAMLTVLLCAIRRRSRGGCGHRRSRRPSLRTGHP